jgi:hypothetical protein
MLEKQGEDYKRAWRMATASKRCSRSARGDARPTRDRHYLK